VLLSDFSLCLLSVGYHELFPGGKVARLRSWPLLTSIQFQGQELSKWSSTFLYFFMAWCIVN
jgi:hypothetical protein